MTHDLETLRHWLHIFLWVTAICTTAFPVLWAFWPWYTTRVGKLLMLQSVAFAAAIDVTLVFQYLDFDPDNILFYFWAEAIIFALISAASVLLTVTMIRMNYHRRKKAQTDG